MIIFFANVSQYYHSVQPRVHSLLHTVLLLMFILCCDGETDVDTEGLSFTGFIFSLKMGGRQICEIFPSVGRIHSTVVPFSWIKGNGKNKEISELNEMQSENLDCESIYFKFCQFKSD